MGHSASDLRCFGSNLTSASNLWCQVWIFKQKCTVTDRKKHCSATRPSAFAFWPKTPQNPLGASVHVNKWIPWWVTASHNPTQPPCALGWTIRNSWRPPGHHRLNCKQDRLAQSLSVVLDSPHSCKLVMGQAQHYSWSSNQARRRRWTRRREQEQKEQDKSRTIMCSWLKMPWLEQPSLRGERSHASSYSETCPHQRSTNTRCWEQSERERERDRQTDRKRRDGEMERDGEGERERIDEATFQDRRESTENGFVREFVARTKKTLEAIIQALEHMPVVWMLTTWVLTVKSSFNFCKFAISSSRYLTTPMRGSSCRTDVGNRGPSKQEEVRETCRPLEARVIESGNPSGWWKLNMRCIIITWSSDYLRESVGQVSQGAYPTPTSARLTWEKYWPTIKPIESSTTLISSSARSQRQSKGKSTENVTSVITIFAHPQSPHSHLASHWAELFKSTCKQNDKKPIKNMQQCLAQVARCERVSLLARPSNWHLRRPLNLTSRQSTNTSICNKRTEPYTKRECLAI